MYSNNFFLSDACDNRVYTDIISIFNYFDVYTYLAVLAFIDRIITCLENIDDGTYNHKGNTMVISSDGVNKQLYMNGELTVSYTKNPEGKTVTACSVDMLTRDSTIYSINSLGNR